MDKRLAVLLLMSVAALPVTSFAATGAAGILEPANNDLTNQASLQRGAKYFVNYCMGCHSAKYVRYNRLAEDLGLSEEQVSQNLMFAGEKIFDTMTIAMPEQDARRWFGQKPPDLSLTARSRGTDWLYSYLRTFYVDPDAPLGVNNLVLSGVSMPHVLWELQGLQAAVFHETVDAEGNPHQQFDHFEQLTAGSLTAEEYDRFVRDLVNFLSYMSEPVQVERRSLGIKVLAFLLIFGLFAYALKKEYWKDVH